MPTPRSFVPQATLLPPEVVTVTLTVGIVGPSGHLQWQLEARNAFDDVLLDLEAFPHFGPSSVAPELARASSKLVAWVEGFLLPF